MPSISIEEWQLLSFFAVEPELLDADLPWCYNDALYQVRRGDLTLSVAIAPAYGDVRLILKYMGDTLYELNARSVRDVRYCRVHLAETLEIEVSEVEILVLRMKPT